MSELDPHRAVKRDVLVRYLDAWTAASLRSHRGATYVESGDFAADAYRVFGEFADRLDGHHLEMVVLGAPAPGEPPAGLKVRSADPRELLVTGPVLAHLDAMDNTLTEPDAWHVVETLATGKAREVLLTLPAGDYHSRLRAAGLACVVAVELVDDNGTEQLLVFATGDSKHLATFKNELWAADEFAGIRFRDPRDTEHALVEIALTPQLLPLRRLLLAELERRGTSTVAELQQYTLLETIYRPADTVGALTSAATAGAISRTPEKGRMTPRTVVSRP